MHVEQVEKIIFKTLSTCRIRREFEFILLSEKCDKDKDEGREGPKRTDRTLKITAKGR
jgi:hypothetical protein